MSNDAQTKSILTVNAGSSSIKFALYNLTEPKKMVLSGSINKIGQPDASFSLSGIDGANEITTTKAVPDYVAASQLLIEWAQERLSNVNLVAIGHRIVHGGPDFSASQVVDAETLEGLRALVEFDPHHLPVEINLIERFQTLFPSAVQVACFDTAFHSTMPEVARRLAIPRRFYDRGVRRYGFHGLSYAYVIGELTKHVGAEMANGRVIVAHMGSGVSLAAIKGGKSLETTMGLTPSGGVPMSVRSGDIDPGLAAFLTHNEKMSFYQIDQMTNFESGLLGISETTGDMKTLIEHQETDPRAKEAVDLFCYQVKKAIGGLTAVLGGLDLLVFTGGIGQDAPKIRAGVCDGLDYLGVGLDATANEANAEVISSQTSKVAVRTIRTDEAATIVRDTIVLVAS